MARDEAILLQDGRTARGMTKPYIREILRAAPGVVLVLALACVPVGRSQSGSGMGSGQNSSRMPMAPRPEMGTVTADDYDSTLMQRRLRALNMERQKELVSDTNKLLKLARELNIEVASQKSDTLTPEQLHKIAEIEKLARNVKERMTAAVGGPQSGFPPPEILYPQPR